MSEDAKRQLSTLCAPEGEVMRLATSPEADQGGELAFRHGRGEGSDQIVQHAGRQVLRIDRSVRTAGFDGSSVEVVEGALGVVPPGNERMLRLLRGLGLPTRTAHKDGAECVEVDVSHDTDALVAQPRTATRAGV